MEKFNKKRLKNIQTRFEEKTGTKLDTSGSYVNYKGKRIVLVSSMVMCFMILSVFAIGRFSDSDENVADSGLGYMEEALSDSLSADVNQVEKGKKTYTADLAYENWVWPTESESISALYGVGINGVFHDHINIAGKLSDEVYAVERGIVEETGYVPSVGNYIVIFLDENITVKYGHLEKISVKEGETVEAGDIIGKLGQTGMATGPNLYFAVYVENETVNPLVE